MSLTFFCHQVGDRRPAAFGTAFNGGYIHISKESYGQGPGDGDFFIRLSKSLRAGVYFIEQYPRIYQIYLKMLFQEDFPFRADLLRAIRLFSMDYLRPIVEEGIRKGEVRQDLDPEVAAFFLDALLDRFLQAYCIAYMDSGLGLFQANEEVIQRRIEDCVNIVRCGMATST